MIEVINTWFLITLCASIVARENYFISQVHWVTDKIDDGIGFVRDSIEHRRTLRRLKSQKELEALQFDERLQTLESIVVEESDEVRRR